MKKLTALLPLTALLLASLACTLLPSTPAPDPGDRVATSVAATLAAGEAAPTPTPDAADQTLVPTETAAPDTPTPEPDLLRVAYVSGGDAWLWTEGGASVQLTSLGDVNRVALSDDGARAALGRQIDPTHQEIWVVSTDGSGLKALITVSDLEEMQSHDDAVATLPAQLDWVPGTHTVAFNTRPVFEGPGYILANDLRLVEADTGALTTLLEPGFGGEFHYAPDGSRIALVLPDQISLIDPDGTNRHDVLSFPYIYTYSEYALYPRPVWRPDSSALRVVIPPQDPLGDPSAATTVWHLPADGSAPTTLATMVTSPYFAHPPRLSPGGDQLAYLVDLGDPADNNRELHTAAADLSTDAVYATGPLSFEAWSPDDLHFVYTENGANPQVGEIGTAPQPISGAVQVRDVEWVGDRRYLYNNRDGSSWELWLGSLDNPNALLASSSELIPYDFIK
jgi:hypothetical protein